LNRDTPDFRSFKNFGSLAKAFNMSLTITKTADSAHPNGVTDTAFNEFSSKTNRVYFGQVDPTLVVIKALKNGILRKQKNYGRDNRRCH